MKAVCQICGVRGWPETLIRCSRCSGAYEHRYCLEDTPKIFELDVKWTCPDCLRRPIKRLLSQKYVDASRSLRRSKRQSEKREGKRSLLKETNGTMGSNARKKILHVDEDEVDEKILDVGAQGRQKSSSKVEPLQLPLTADLSDHNLLNGSLSGKAESKGQPSLDDIERKDSDFKRKVLSLSNRFVSDAIKKDESSFTTDNDFYIPAQPIVDPIWKGCFSIHSEGFERVDGVAAHLSSKACLKVREEACLLPANISSGILPKADVWPKSFLQAKPTDDNIGLYFFPETERDEKIYNSLIEDMMSHDLALRCVVENAELLVFTSIELPFEHWRFRGNHYLWGVFRAKQAACLSSITS